MVVRARWAEAGAWWLISCGLWLLTAAPVSAPEFAVAAAAGLPCAAAAGAARRTAGSSWRVRWAWAHWLPALLPAVLGDTARALTAPRRRCPPTALRRVRLPGEPDGAAAATRRALVTLLLSLTPGSYVQDVRSDGRGDVVVLHTLGGGRHRMEKVVGR